MKRPTKRPLTPAELDRLFSQAPPAVEEEERRRRRGKVVGPREAELRRLREAGAKAG